MKYIIIHIIIKNYHFESILRFFFYGFTLNKCICGWYRSTMAILEEDDL